MESRYKEAKDFTQKYSGVTGFEFYGMTQFVYPFINDRWPGEIAYDRDHINVMSLDIETMSDDGFLTSRQQTKHSQLSQSRMARSMSLSASATTRCIVQMLPTTSVLMRKNYALVFLKSIVRWIPTF
jgi:hypothetical protein